MNVLRLIKEGLALAALAGLLLAARRREGRNATDGSEEHV